MPTRLAPLLLLAVIVTGSTSCADRDDLPAAADRPETAVQDPPAAALTVTHDPNPAPAQLGGRSGQAFSWEYATSVTATDADVTIVEFGVEAWRRGAWELATVAGRPYSAEQFAGWYGCPGAVIRAGETVTDLRNFSGGPDPALDPLRWYYLGVTATGDTVRAEAAVQHLIATLD
jgi:hypothetical protein